MVIDQRLVEAVNLQLEVMKITSKKIRSNATTRKESGGRYPIPTGYSRGSRRPMLDVVKWMSLMETTLEMILEELSQ